MTPFFFKNNIEGVMEHFTPEDVEDIEVKKEWKQK